jgi:prepilin-type N-terminal cleavage/methylation domain-containing protein/prepilin-type processing-associated H-X9-DG protein
MRYSLDKKCRKKGFTLVELLVVISIIALLMSVLMPALSRARKQAQAVQCSAGLKQLGLAWHIYADNWDGYFPVGLTWDATEPYAWLAWWKKKSGIASYMPSENAFDYQNREEEEKMDVAYTGWYCPAHTKEAVKNGIAVGYHFNHDIGFYRSVKKAKVSNSSSIPLLYGYWDENAEINPLTGFKGHLQNYFSKPTDPPLPENGAIAYKFTESVKAVHGEIGTNFLFVDGHVERIMPLDSQVDYAKRFRWEIPQGSYKVIPRREAPSGW